jgi:hypothetical protein
MRPCATGLRKMNYLRRFSTSTPSRARPDREPLETLEHIRRTIGEYNFAGQYQQSPAPLGVFTAFSNKLQAVECGFQVRNVTPRRGDDDPGSVGNAARHRPAPTCGSVARPST